MALHFSSLPRMDIISFKLYRYQLPYHPPFELREGLLLHLIHSQGEGWGEIAPLPGRSRETLREAQEQLVSVLMQQTDNLPPLLPSVSFGLYSALHPLNNTPPIPLAALLAGSVEQIIAKAEQAHKQGFQCAKVKISGMPLRQAILLLQHLSSYFQLRIDANRAFSFQEAVDLCAQCPNEYIEEPTYEVDQLDAFPFPYALDETLLEKRRPKNCHVIVYKPTVLGWPTPLSGPLSGKQCVFSSACETGIGILHIARLSAAFSPGVPCGLDTYRFLEHDILQSPLDFSSGTLCMPQKLCIDRNRLQEVYL